MSDTIDRVAQGEALQKQLDDFYAAAKAEIAAKVADVSTTLPATAVDLDTTKAAIPNETRDNARIAFIIEHIDGFASAVKSEEVPTWQATVIGGNLLIIPTIQDLFAKYVTTNGLME